MVNKLKPIWFIRLSNGRILCAGADIVAAHQRAQEIIKNTNLTYIVI